MAKIKLSRKEIEKMIKDQLGCKEVDWDKSGDAQIELDLDEIKKKEITIERHDHYHSYPVYTSTPTKPYYPYYWGITTNKTSGNVITYNATNTGGVINGKTI
jgi:hypothetical protein